MALLAEAVAEVQADPAIAKLNTREDIGGCLKSARRFAVALEQRGVEYEIRRYRGLPGWRTEWQHVTLVAGEVYDFIAPQYRDGDEWPDVRPLAEFEAEFGSALEACPRCGSTGDLDAELRKRPLEEHECLGPDERAALRRLEELLEPQYPVAGPRVCGDSPEAQAPAAVAQIGTPASFAARVRSLCASLPAK